MNEFKAKVYQTAIDQLKQKETLLAEERKNIIESILEEEKTVPETNMKPAVKR